MTGPSGRAMAVELSFDRIDPAGTGRWQSGGNQPIEVARRSFSSVLPGPMSTKESDRRTLFDGNFEFSASHASFDISPDGKEFLLPKSQSADARIIVVYDWREQL